MDRVLPLGTRVKGETPLVSAPIRLTDKEADALRAKGHAIPERVRIQKDSGLTLDERRHCIKKLYVVKKLFTKMLLVKGYTLDEMPFELPRHIRGGTYRFAWAQEDERRSLYDKFVAPDPVFVRFLANTWKERDGAEKAGEFSTMFETFCTHPVSKVFVDVVLKTLDMEGAGCTTAEIDAFAQQTTRPGPLRDAIRAARAKEAEELVAFAKSVA